MKIIVGLGNPGAKYETTRHNVGFITADLIADELNTELDVKGIQCLYNTVFYNGEKICILKPQTYMNNSGDCVGKVARYYKVENKDILVICDDLSLPEGTMRFRSKGSSGGHNGLKSIIAHLGGDDFPRIKIGIGRGDDVIDYVLGHFGKKEWELVSSMMRLAVDAVKVWLDEGDQAVMNRFNKYSKLPKENKKGDCDPDVKSVKEQRPLISPETVKNSVVSENTGLKMEEKI